MARLLDYAGGRPGAAAIKAAGFAGAVRYLANSPERGLPNKILTPEEADDFRAHGLMLVGNWQKGKHESADWRRGYDGGVADAKAAQEQVKKCQGDLTAPIYFSVDEDVDLATYNRLVLPYLQGCEFVLGKARVGVYGGQRTMWWAKEDGYRWLWQTRGWSRYNDDGWQGVSIPVQWVEDTQIRQERVDEDRVNGVGVDINTTWAEDYGQWGFPRGTEPAPVEKPKPSSDIQPNPNWRGNATFLADVLRAFGIEVWEADGWKTRKVGTFGQILGVVAHHTAGGGSNDWKIVLNGRSDLPGPLSQLTLERDGSVRLLAAGTCNHAGRGSWPGIPTNNGNGTTIGIEAVSRGVRDANGNFDWTEEQLAAYPVVVGAILWFLGHDADMAMGHKEYSSEGKIDPAGIDMHEFRAQVQAVIDAGPEGGDGMPSKVKNYLGQEHDTAFVIGWLDKRAALTERYFAAILDKLAGEGTAAKIKADFEKDISPEFRG